MGDDTSKNLLTLSSDDFVLPNFVEHVDDFESFSHLLSGEVDFPSLDCEFVGGSNTVSHGQGDNFGAGYDADSTIGHPNSLLMDGLLNQLDERDKNGGEDEDNHSSSDTTTTTTNTTLSTPTTKKTSRVDRSRTLISERRRRGRMKEKLYALRALVPNITKVT